MPAASSVRTSGSAQASTVDVTTPRAAFFAMVFVVVVCYSIVINEAFILLIKIKKKINRRKCIIQHAIVFSSLLFSIDKSSIYQFSNCVKYQYLVISTSDIILFYFLINFYFIFNIFKPIYITKQ